MALVAKSNIIKHNKKILGIDRGLYNLITDSNGKNIKATITSNKWSHIAIILPCIADIAIFWAWGFLFSIL